MKKLGILLLACITALNLWADEFKIGKLTFETISPTEVSLKGVDIDISKVYLSETIDYQGNTYTLTEIGSGAFGNCSSLVSVTIPNSVTSIESTAFRYCSSLTSVTIPNSVTSIGDGAFSYCSSLTSVTIPNSVTSIGDGAFSYCSSLTSVTIPNGVTEIGDDAFANTALFNDPTNWDNGALYINDCLIAVDASVVGNYKIKENTRLIGGGAFADCSALTSVTIPNSVTSIGDYAFYGCNLLSSVTIPNSVTSIGNFAFEYCSSLTSVTIPNSVTSIGWDAFWECSSLTSVTIPNSVTSIGSDAFSNTALFNDPTNWDNGALYINDCLIAVDATFVGNYKIKENTRLIGGGAFADCSALTSVTIPNSVTNIGWKAFYGCKSLTSVTIPNSVTKIERKVFMGCSSLTSITIPNSVTEIGEEVFADCSSLTSVTIPNSVTEIGGAAFDDCSSLTSVTIPNSVTSIGYEAFEDCSSLTFVTIPNSVTWIGYEAFKDCPSLTSIIVASDNITYDSRNNCNAIIQTTTNTLIAGCHNTIIPNSVTRIGVGAFNGCSSLTSVTIPNSVASIGIEAFRNCSSLTSVTIPNSVTEIGIEAFCGCTSLRHITIPKSLEPMGWNLFCDSFDFATIHYSETESSSYNSPTYKYQTEEEPLVIRKVQLQEDGETYSVPAVEGQLVIMFDEDMSHEESTNMLKEKGLSIISSIPELNYYLVQVPVGEEGQYFSQLNDNNLVDYVYPNAIEYFCSASAYALDNYNKTSDHGRRVSKMLTGCDSMMNKASCDPMMNLEEKNVADSVGNLIQNTIDSTLALILLPLPKDSSNDQVVINMSIGTALFNKDGEYEGVKWDHANVTETNRIDYRRSYVNGLKGYINLVKNFDDEDFVIVKAAGNERMKQLETIIDTLISELDQEELKVFERHFLIVAAKDVTRDYSNDVSRYHKMVSKVDISDMTRQDPYWAGTSFSSPRLAGYIYKLAEKYDLPATTVLKYVRSATEKATDNIVTYELIEQEIANANHFVDLGLPSGTLWKAHTEKGIYNYQNAIKKFVKGPNQLPTYDQLLELRQYCQWQPTNTGYKLIGPNGNSITVSDEGEFDAGRVWSSTKAGIDEVYTIGIGGLNRTRIQLYNQNVGNLVHLVQSAEKDNIITYTSSDGNIINPSANSFGATIVSNTYKNGRGTIIFDGPVTSIGEGAFRDCSSLTSINIPNSVTGIGWGAFDGCFSLTSLTIPNSVTYIGWDAFDCCFSLTSVTIPNSVTEIGGWAFSDCYSLTSVTIPNSVEWIANWAFDGCSSLTSLTIPISVTTIGSGAFNGCSALTSITVDAGNTHFDSRNNSNAIIETATNTLIAGCKTTTIPNSVTRIGSHAFHGCSSLTSITIPNSVTWIGWDAFHGCSSLTTITIPNSVTAIGDEAFKECESLTSVTIPNSVTAIGEEMFKGCSSLTSVTIPNSVKSIGDRAFEDCSSLSSVTIPNSVTRIGDWAFWDCSSLTSVTIPNSVTEVRWIAFPEHTQIIRR